jgi:TonB-linked SusC/RagA family outer membrane protein
MNNFNIVGPLGSWLRFALIWRKKPINVSLIRLIMRVSFINIILFVCGIKVLSATPAYEQDLDKVSVKIELNDDKLPKAFSQIEEQTKYTFVFSGQTIANTIRTLKGTFVLKDALEQLLANTGFTYQLGKFNQIVISKIRDDEKKGQNDQGYIQPVPTSPTINITGRVSDAATQTPIPGVNILVKGTTRGTTSDGEGRYTIDVSETDYLVFTFIGFKTLEVSIGTRTSLNVTLEEDLLALDEVIINAGYYNVSDKEKTGNIEKIGADIISKQTVTNPMGALIGRMPGVNIQQTTGVPGGDFKIEIRGRNSLRSDAGANEPLYIIDGVPFSSDKISSNENTKGIINGGVSPLTSINPADIESIEVLKDADATAIYGSRAANGIVLITTKKGSAGKTKIDVNISSGLSKAPLRNLLNTQQYIAMRLEAFRNDKLTPSSDTSDNGSIDRNYRAYAPDLMVWDTNRYTDWQKKLIGGNANTTSFQASISGGSKDTQFITSTGFLRQGSVFPGNLFYQKFSSHLSLNHKSTDGKFKLHVSVSGSSDSNDQLQYDFSSIARTLAPNAPNLYSENGTLNWAPHPTTGQSTWINPLSELERTYEGRVHSLISSIVVGYKILPNLEIQASIGTNRLSSNELNITPSTFYDPSLGRGPEFSSIIVSDGSTQSLIAEPQLNWKRQIDKGQFTFLVGGTYQEQHHALLSSQYGNFPSNAMLRNVAAAKDRTLNQNVSTIYKYAASYGRINYNWNGKYIVNLTGRRDGSSRFGPGRQYANFGAIGAAWVFSQESFITEILSILSFGKLRASYGVTGSDKIGDYRFFDTFAISTVTPNQYNNVTGLDPTRLFNADFAWETNRKIEVALELGFLNDRISLTTAYYRNRSSNQLVNYTLPKITGFSGILANLQATVQNSGFEFSLSTSNVQTTSWTWNTSLNFSIPKNKLIEFPGLDSSSYANTYIVGRSIYIQKYFEYNGVNSETGTYTFKDYNNDGILSDPADTKKAIFVGQNFFGGINNSVRYKSWAFDVFLQVVKQAGPAVRLATGIVNLNAWASLLEKKRWQNPGDDAEIQRFATEYNTAVSGLSGTAEKFTRSDASITDASFLRLKTASLSYQFRSKRLNGYSMRAYLQGQNLFTVTKYEGNDPETQSFNLPPLRTVIVGLNLTLQ